MVGNAVLVTQRRHRVPGIPQARSRHGQEEVMLERLIREQRAVSAWQLASVQGGSVLGGEEAAKAAGGGGDCRGVGEGMPGEDRQERTRRLGQGGPAGAGIGLGQVMQGGGELAAGVGVAPGVGVQQHRGDCQAEFLS
jgi:hypothetical protein